MAVEVDSDKLDEMALLCIVGEFIVKAAL